MNMSREKQLDANIVPMNAANNEMQVSTESRRECLKSRGIRKTKAPTAHRGGRACHRRLRGYGRL